jgi:polyhydroxyalkanoate synthesis regulator protein
MAEAFGGGSQALEAMTRQNLQMFERAMRMFTPFGLQAGRSEEQARASNGTAEPRAKPSEEINELKSEMEAMRRQLSELARARK